MLIGHNRISHKYKSPGFRLLTGGNDIDKRPIPFMIFR